VSTAGLLLLTPRLRTRGGPALRPAPLPVTATVLSAIVHAALAVVVILAATVWTSPPSKTYVVNLVPLVAAVGTPQGRPAPLPRVEEPPPRVTRRTPSEPAEREPARAPAPPPELPARSPSLPDPPTRTAALPARALPDRTLPDRTLPDRPLPPRPPAAPRAGEKELPAVASAPAPPAPAPPAPAPPAPSASTAPSRPEPPPPPVGQPSGSAQGAGAVTLNVTDFPFAWYLAAVQRKVTERWGDRAQPGRQPVVVFEITRDGQVSSVSLKDSSGNGHYDRLAVRAIADAAPFPKLPDEWPRPSLVIQMGFTFAPDRG
jgi:TonB family protein